MTFFSANRPTSQLANWPEQESGPGTNSMSRSLNSGWLASRLAGQLACGDSRP